MKTEIVKTRVSEAQKRDFEAVAAARGWNIDPAIHELMEQYAAYEKQLRNRFPLHIGNSLYHITIPADHEKIGGEAVHIGEKGLNLFQRPAF